MTTPAEAAADLYEQLKPQAIHVARDFVMARTPPDLQEEMVAVIEEDLEEAVEETSPPTVVDVPMIWQEGAVLNCTLGNWNGSPNSRTYQWKIDGTDVGTSVATYTRLVGDVGKTATCVMTATNAAGTSAPVTSNAITVAA